MFKKLFAKQNKDCCGVEIIEVKEETKTECCEETSSQQGENCCDIESNGY
ncbi:hypothetical protein [Peribacillus alkalitolerans]|nr:hypothetical protein [Peribacillus alkalitolerans]